MSRALCVFATFVAVLAGADCGDTIAGKLCQPGDKSVCGEGFQCMTFCDAAGGPESICTPSFGAEAGESFANEALIDDKVTFGQLGNVRIFEKDLRIEAKGVRGIALPLVEEVHGNLSITGTDIECISLPRLNTVDGVFTIDLNAKLVKNEIDSLETAGGLVVTDNEKLAEMLLTSALSFGGDVIIDRNKALDFVNLESLQSVQGNFTMRSNTLSQLHLDVLDQVTGCVDIELDPGTCNANEPPALDGASCDGDALRTASPCL